MFSSLYGCCFKAHAVGGERERDNKAGCRGIFSLLYKHTHTAASASAGVFLEPRALQFQVCPAVGAIMRLSPSHTSQNQHTDFKERKKRVTCLVFLSFTMFGVCIRSCILIITNRRFILYKQFCSVQVHITACI